METTDISNESAVFNTTNGRSLGRDSPSISIDSGSSMSARGRKWAEWRIGSTKIAMGPSPQKFRSGEGPPLGSLGTKTIFTHVRPEMAGRTNPSILPVQVGADGPNVPMLIPHESLCRLKGSIDFKSRALIVPGVGGFRSVHTKSGHLMIQCQKPPREILDSFIRREHPIYMAEMVLLVRALPEDTAAEMHARLGRISENTLLAKIRSSQMQRGISAIRNMSAKCGRRNAVRRIALHSVACRLGKYHGEIVAMDIISPFGDCFDGRIATEYHALFATDILSMPIKCSLLIARASEHARESISERLGSRLRKAAPRNRRSRRAHLIRHGVCRFESHVRQGNESRPEILPESKRGRGKINAIVGNCRDEHHCGARSNCAFHAI